MAFAAPRACNLQQTVWPRDLLYDPTYDEFTRLKIEAFERALSISGWAQCDTRVRTRRVVVRNDFIRTGLYVATQIGLTVFVVIQSSARNELTGG